MSFPNPIGDYASSDDSNFGEHLPRDTNGPETSVNHHTAEDYTAENTPPTTVDSIGAGSQLAPSLTTEIDAKATDPAKLAQKEVTKAILPHLRRPLGVLKTSSSSSPIIQTNAEAIASDLAKKEVAKLLLPHLRGRTLVDQPTPSSATMVDTKDLSSAKAVKEKVSNPIPPHLRGLSSVVQTRKESLKNGQNSTKLSEEVLTRTTPPETVATSADESDATQTDTDEPETAATIVDEPGTTATYSNEPETAEADVTEAKTAEIETAPVPGDISREPSPKTSFEQSAQAGSDISVETAKPVSSIGATGKAILLHIEAIEATEYLSAEAIALLHEVRDDIVARAVDASTAVNFLSAKAFKDPARSVEQHLIKPVSPIKTDAQSRIKPATEESTIRQPVTSPRMVSQSAATSPIPSIGLKKIPASALATSANEQISSQSSSDLTETTSNATAPMSQVSSPADRYLTNIIPAETASAVGAKAVSAKPANGGKANSTAVSTISSGENDENREHKAYFATWGKLQERNTPTAKVRTVVITDLPDHTTPSFVASIVYGGPLEDINILCSPSGRFSARVRFIYADDCENYYDETSNGLVYGKNKQNQDLVVFVQLGKDVDVVGGLLRSWIEQDITRCVRAVGIGKEWPIDSLKKDAETKNKKLEGITDTVNPIGSRVVVWRFCRIADAVTFKAALVRNIDHEQANVQYTIDPCAGATGVHFGK